MNLREQAIQGIAWTVVTKPFVQVFQYCISIFLARLLTPDDFGLVAMAAVLTGFAGIFVDLGIGAAIVQQPELTDSQIRAAFLATIGTGALLSLLFVLVAPGVAAFYRREELVGITRLSSLAFLLSAVGVVPRALLQRQMRLKTLVLLDALGTVGSGVAALLVAHAGGRYWSIVWFSLFGVIGTSIPPLIACGRYPSGGVDLRALRPLLRVSLNLLFFNIINYWARNLDNLLIGRTLGDKQLGVYSRAYQLMLLPQSQIGGVLAVGVAPALSRMQDDSERASRIFLRAQGLIAAVAFPLMLGMAVVADAFVAAVYGPKWAQVAPLLKILGVAGALQCVVTPAGWIFISSGRADILARWGLFTSAAIIAAISVGAALGSTRSVAVAYLIINALLFFPELLIAGKILGVGIRDILGVLWKPALCALVMVVTVAALRVQIPSLWPAWQALLALVGFGALVYTGLAVAIGIPILREIRLLRASRL
ncbi:MAG TPA: lipopolysaccharide biosynthesis protein [Polyangia bacterium]|jgi:PST family polysaccharide transporter